MANIFNYGLLGIGSSVQLGKGGSRIRNNAGVVETRNAADTALANFLAANIDGANGAFSGTLTVTGNATFNALAFLSDGTVAAPSLAFTNDTNTGLYSVGADQLGVSVGGAQAMLVNSPTADASVVVFGGDAAITLPSGPNSGRPTTPVAGMIRFNDVSNIVEYYDGTNWVSSSGLIFLNFAVANAGGGSASGSPSVADSSNDTLTLDAGVGINLVSTPATDTIAISFTRTGLVAKTTPVLADTVALFDSASSNAPSYSSFTEIFNALDVPNGFSANGLLVRTADDVYASRSIVASTTAGQEGIIVVNGDGVSGNPTVGLNINGLTATTTITDSDEFVVWEDTATANRKVTALNVRSYMAAAADPLVRRAAGVSVDDAVNISTTLPSTPNVYVTRIVINVTTAAAGGVNGTITDGTNTLVTAAEWDWNATGVYIVELPLAVASTSGQLQFAFGTAPTTAGTATVTAEYKIAT